MPSDRLSPLQGIVSLLRGAMDESQKIDLAKKQEAEQLRQESLVFAKENYKAALAKKQRYDDIAEKLVLTGPLGAAAYIADQYNVDAPTKEALTKDWAKKFSGEEGLQKFQNVVDMFGGYPTPKIEDYMPGKDYTDIVNERIKQENAFNHFFFGGKRGPSMLSNKQLRDKQGELLKKSGGKDVQSWRDQMASLGLDFSSSLPQVSDVPEFKNIEQAAIWYAEHPDRDVPEGTQKLIKAKLLDKDGTWHGTGARVNKDGSQDLVAFIWGADEQGKVKVIDSTIIGEKRSTPAAEPVSKDKRREAYNLFLRQENLSPAVSEMQKRAMDLYSKAEKNITFSEDDIKTSAHINAFIGAIATRAEELTKVPNTNIKTFEQGVDTAWKEVQAQVELHSTIPSWLQGWGIDDYLKGFFSEPRYQNIPESKGGGSNNNVITPKNTPLPETKSKIPQGSQLDKASGLYFSPDGNVYDSNGVIKGTWEK